MWSDPLVTRYIGGKPSTRRQTWSRLLTYPCHWALMGFGYWVLEDKATRYPVQPTTVRSSRKAWFHVPVANA